MRCNKHISDLSSSIGVCASCLRERLFVLIAAQVEENRRKGEERRKAEHQPPLVFPRSVSPYICRRSDDSSWHNNDRRFYSTPQVGPTFSFGSSKKKHSSSGKFSIFSTLFRSSRSDVSVSDISSSDSKITSSPFSSSWFSNIMPSRRKKKNSRFAPPPPVSHHRRKEKGMSPANVDEDQDRDRDYDAEDGSPLESGYSSESHQGARKSAGAVATAPSGRRRGSTLHSRNVPGLAFCLSPLVRASPNSHRGQKDATIGFSGEIARKPAKVTLSTAASLCANRSRKLADFGRDQSFRDKDFEVGPFMAVLQNVKVENTNRDEGVNLSTTYATGAESTSSTIRRKNVKAFLSWSSSERRVDGKYKLRPCSAAFKRFLAVLEFFCEKGGW